MSKESLIKIAIGLGFSYKVSELSIQELQHLIKSRLLGKAIAKHLISRKIQNLD